MAIIGFIGIAAGMPWLFPSLGPTADLQAETPDKPSARFYIGIELVYLPPYSPDLNPIEFIWKSIKKIISKEFIVDVNHMKEIIYRSFHKFSSKMSFAKRWIEKFLNNKLEMLGS